MSYSVRVGVAAVGTLAAIELLQFVHLDLLLIVAMPLVLALALPVAMTMAVRVVLAAGCCYGINFVSAFLMGLVGIPFEPATAALALALPLAIAVGTGRLALRVGQPIEGADLIAILSGAVVLILLWLPTARDTSAHLLSRLISDGEDNAAHLGIVQAISIQHGLLFGRAQAWSGRLVAGHTAYPPGFHVNVALVVAGVDDLFGRATPARLVRAYFYAILGLQSLWAMAMVLAIRAMGPLRRNSLAALLVTAFAVVLFFLFGPPSALMNWGFQSQIAALWMLTLELFLAATPDLDEHPTLRLALMLLAMLGTTWSWYLVSPVAWLIAFAALWLDRTVVLPRLPFVAVAWVMAALLSLPPIFFGLRIGAPGYINANGGVYILDRVFIAALVVAALASALLPAEFSRFRSRLLLIAGLLGAGLLALAVHWYQVRTAGTAGYFYEKLLYTVAIVAALGAGLLLLAGVASGIAAAGRWAWKQAAAALAFGMLAWLSTGVLTYPNPGRHYLTGTRIFPDVGAMHYLLVAKAPGDARQVLFWGDQPQVFDYLSSRFAAGLFLRNTDERNDFMASNAYKQDDGKLLQLLHASRDGLWLITRDPNLRDRLSAAGFSQADLDRLVIDTVTEPLGGPSGRRSYDISPRGLLPSLFRPR